MQYPTTSTLGHQNNIYNNEPQSSSMSFTPLLPDTDNSALTTEIMSALHHIFKLAIDESFLFITPAQAASTFPPPFNTSPYYDLILKTLTDLYSQFSEISLVCSPPSTITPPFPYNIMKYLYTKVSCVMFVTFFEPELGNYWAIKHLGYFLWLLLSFPTPNLV